MPTLLNPIVPLLSDFYQRAGWNRETADYVKTERLDLDVINAHAGMIAVLPVAFHGNGTFSLDGDASGAVIEVLGDDGETTIDLCAWQVEKPGIFATAIGAASILGAVNVANPASWAFGEYLAIHKTPLEWLKADCRDVCVLDYREAPYELSQALGPILAQDVGHATELRKFLCKPPLDPSQIIYPRQVTARAA